MGKSSLALHLVSRGLDFVSNDRLLIQRRSLGWQMLGAPKLPRVNPGTILGNESLTSVMPADLRRQAASLPDDELWRLEQKYDVFLDECFGPGRFQLRADMAGLVVLNWRRAATPLEIRTADLRERDDLLAAFRKSPGLFYQPETGAPTPDLSPPAYLEALEGCPAFEIRGGADFATAADACAAFLKTGDMPLGRLDANAIL
jgi:HprK-related kinase B